MTHPPSTGRPPEVRAVAAWHEALNSGDADRLDPLRIIHNMRTVLVEHEAGWRSPETGELSGKQVVASVFVGREGKITSVARHPELTDALCAAGFDEFRVSEATGTGSGKAERS